MNATLSTFADFRIRGAILDEIRSMQWASKDARRKVNEVRPCSMSCSRSWSGR